MDKSPRPLHLLALFAAALGLAVVGSLVGGELGRRAGAAAGHVGDGTIGDAFLGAAIASIAFAALGAWWLKRRLATPAGWAWALVVLALVLDWGARHRGSLRGGPPRSLAPPLHDRQSRPSSVTSSSSRSSNTPATTSGSPTKRNDDGDGTTTRDAPAGATSLVRLGLHLKGAEKTGLRCGGPAH